MLFALTIIRLIPEVADKPIRLRKRGPNKVGWREAERYFKKERDAKIKPTLPRLAFMEASRG